MKKINLILTFFAALLVVFSCVKVEEGGGTEVTPDPVPDPQPKPSRVVSLDAERSSSTAIEWLDDDRISVVFTNKSSKAAVTEFTTDIQGGAPSAKAIFTADFSNDITIAKGYDRNGYAVWPASVADSYGKLTFALPQMQTAGADGCAQASLMLASAGVSLTDINDDDSARLLFKDAVSVIRFKASADIASVTLSGTSEIAGQASLIPDAEGLLHVDGNGEWKNPATSITLSPSAGVETFADGVVYSVVVWPGEHSSVKISVDFKELGVIETTSDASLKLEAGKSYTIDFESDSGSILKEISDLVEDIEGDIAEIKDRVGSLPAIMDQLQSVVVMSEYAENIALAKYSDFSSYRKKEDLTLNYMVRPASVAAELVSKFSESVSAQICYRNASGTLSFAVLPISQASLSGDIMTVKVDADGLSDAFYKGELSAQLALQISDGQTDMLSDFIDLMPQLSAGLDMRKVEGIPALKEATLSMPFSYAVTSDLYTLSVSVEGLNPSDVRLNYHDASKTGYIYVTVKESDVLENIKADIILTSDQEQVTQSLTFADGGPFDVQVSGDVDYIGGEVSLDVTGNSYGSYTLQLATGGWIYQTSTGVDGHYTVDYNNGAERTASVVYTINTNDASANGAITYTKSVSIIQRANGTALLRDYFSDGESVVMQAASASVPNKLNLVILGDGYQKKDLLKGGKFERSAASVMSAFFGVEPYTTFRDRFNVYMVAYESENEGPRLETAPESSHKTYFETYYKGGGNTYLNTSTAGQNKIFDIVKNNLGLKDNAYYRTVVILLSNTTENIGSTAYPSMTTTNKEATGDGYASFSIAMIAANSTATGGLVRHEAGGHAFGRLADEYVVSWYTPSVVNERHSLGFYRNVATDTSYWDDFTQAGYTSAEVMYDQYISGLYRSTRESGIMWNNNGIFNAVSRWAIYDRIRKQTEGDSDYWSDFLKYDIKNK